MKSKVANIIEEGRLMFKKFNVISSQLSLTILVGLNVVVAFTTQFVIYIYIGAGAETDAFVSASTIPQIITSTISIALSSVLVPMFSGETTNNQNRYGWNMLAIVGGVAFGISIIFYLTSPWWIPVIFPGFDDDTTKLCVSLFKIQIFSMIFVVMASVITAVYYARQRFHRIEFGNLAISIVSILVLFITLPIWGIIAAAWVVLLRILFQVVIFLPALGYPQTVSIKSKYVTETWQRIKPMLMANAYYKSDILVDRYLLSMGSIGEVSIYGLAQQLYSTATSVIGKVWAQTAIPKLSIFAKKKDTVGFIQLYKQRLIFLFTLSLFAYIVLIIIGEPLLQLLFGHGKMTESNVHQLWVFMIYLGGTLIFGIVGILTAASYYAIGNTKTPTFLGIITYTLVIPAKIVAFNYFGVLGVCFVASIYYFINVMLQYFIFPRHLLSLRDSAV
ncbi:MAG: lipid II flippase MurJ [Pseudomonadota bacterium]